MKRREAREKAFQFLFQIDINQEVSDELVQEYLEDNDNDTFLRHLIEGVMDNREDLDDRIAFQLENWSLDRLPSVERTVLRIATFEIDHMDDIPPNVSMNEAVELGNLFGDEKSGKFINGVLSKINEQRGNKE